MRSTLADPLTLNYSSGAVINMLRASPSISPKNNSILITGLGAVGMAALFAAVYLKLGNIIVVDVLPSKLEMAKEFGAHHALDGRDKDVVQRIKELTGGLGVKWAVEATGNTKVSECGGLSLLFDWLTVDYRSSRRASRPSPTSVTS